MPILPVFEKQGYPCRNERNEPEVRKVLEMVRYERIAEWIHV